MNQVAVDALVLAGRDTEIKEDRSFSSRSLCSIGGKPMLEYVIDALKDTEEVGKIIVVVPKDMSLEAWSKKPDTVIKNDGTLTENISLGLEELNADGMVLVVSSDIPLLTPEAISDFLSRCKEKESKVYYPIIKRGDVEINVPQAKRTYVQLKDGTFTGGNIVLVDPEVFKNNIMLMERVYGARKNPISLARIVGLRFVLKLLLHQLTVGEIEKKISGLIQATGCAIITPYYQIGIDVDKDSDLELAREVLAH